MYCRKHNQYHKGLIQKGVCLFRIGKNEIPNNKQIHNQKDIFKQLGHLRNTIYDKKTPLAQKNAALLDTVLIVKKVKL